MAKPGALKGRRILLMRNDRIGDLVLALPLLQALKDAGAFVGVLASPYAAPLLEADERVDALVPDGVDAVEALRGHGFDTALVLWGSWANAIKAWRAGIPRRLGASARPFSWLFNRRLPLRRGQGWEHEGALNFAFGRALGLDREAPPPRLRLGRAPLAQADAWLKRHAPAGSGPLVGLHPGSRGSAQPWPARRFGELGAVLAADHGARILVTGGPGDEAEVAECRGPLPQAACLDGALSLPAFAALLGRLQLFVAGSTGPLHLAAAQGTPVLGLYPPLRAMSPLRWGPRGSRRAVLSPAGLGFRAPVREGVNYVERISVDEAAAACGFLLRED
jgi:ADP-heptose:LPS heptosyltransferase